MTLKNKIRLTSSEVVPMILERDIDLFRILLSLQHELIRLSRITQKNFQITTTQKIVLQIVRRFPGITPSRLAVLLSTPLSTLSGIISKMTKAKLIKLVADKADRRRVHVYLNRKGQALLGEADSNVEQSLKQTLICHSNQTYDYTRDFLLDLVASLRSKIDT